MRTLTLEELDREIEITERDLAELRQQRAELAPAEPRQKATDRVMAYMRTKPGPVSKHEILTATGIKPDNLSLAIGQLKRRGVIEVAGWGTYRVKSTTVNA